MHSQNREADIIAGYFNGHIGTLLDIGANDGITFSNSYDLIEKGWSGHLVEPSPKAFEKLSRLYTGYDNVRLHNFGISKEFKRAQLFESGAHVPNGSDIALVSSIHRKETKRWEDAGVLFEPQDIVLYTFEQFLQKAGESTFDFISIDAEGEDLNILLQIDLAAIGCKCLCIEWNSIKAMDFHYTEYCAYHGLKEIHRNAENIIFAR